MGKHYLIDGYNLMHQLPDLKGRMRQDLEETRNALVVRLSGFAQYRKVKVSVVFDGRDGHERHVSRKGLVKVVFSKSPEEADHVIKRMIDCARHPRKWIVVSSDGEIQRFARLCGVQFLKSSDFIKEMRPSVKSKIENKFVYELSNREVDEWMQLFQMGPERDE